MTVAVNHSFSSACDELGPVKVRSTHPDPYQGLRGHEYIAARKLNIKVQRVQTSAQNSAQSFRKAAK